MELTVKQQCYSIFTCVVLRSCRCHAELANKDMIIVMYVTWTRCTKSQSRSLARDTRNRTANSTFTTIAWTFDLWIPPRCQSGKAVSSTYLATTTAFQFWSVDVRSVKSESTADLNNGRLWRHILSTATPHMISEATRRVFFSLLFR